ncbi:MAG: hypothetical protein EVJ48_07115 [Candidatus Acidulodesulfobacterium acidiphilum]|uniref:Glycosyltransferase RgtA/B/C/D-like domain-containing protein n=1 Tax=Candidatus Acidulodesulfobacterium acidiphilum TaxID=2597224 RepID=A0A520XB95_9DELT|nr:MAG: hypothetical protein EVJ48_07115 [Candidatus Acidulodesulfobacterium acidiphilum]
MTYPLILHFSSVMPGNGGDEYLMAWFFWEFYRSVFILHKLPYFTHLVYYPHGVPLYVTTAMPVNAVIASVIYFFTKNLILSFNVLFLAASILNAYFAYLLAYDTVCSRTASFFAGLIFAFSPILIEQARWGDINIWSAYGIPLYILFFNRLYRNPNLKNALLAALGLFLATYAGFYEFTAILFLYSVFFILYKYISNYSDYRKSLIKGPESSKPVNDISRKIKSLLNNPALNRRYLKYLSVMILSFVIVSSPLLLPAFYYVYFKPRLLNFNPNLFWSKAYSSTIISFFTPPFYNRLLINFTKAIYFNGIYPIMYRGANSVDFLGYIPLVFFIIAVIKMKSVKDKELKFYLSAFILFVLMSLSPLIHIVNNIRVFDPFVYLLDIMPVIKDIQESGRYMIIGYLFFGIVCAYGIKAFFDYLGGKIKTNERAGGSIKKALSGIMVILIFAGTLAGYSASPFEMRAEKASRGVYILKKEPYGAVLTIPFMQGGFKMYEQTIYDKPMIGGYIIRYGFHDLYKKYLPQRFYSLKGIHYNGNGINQIVINRLGDPSDIARNFKYLKVIGVRYIIIKKNLLSQEYGWDKKRAKEVLRGLKPDGSILSVIYNGKNIMILKLKF